MNRLKYFVVLPLFLLAASLLPTPSPAAGVKGASLTVYNSGRALVNETRSVTLPKGPASVVFKNIPASLDPTSVRAAAKGMTVNGLEYSYVPINRQTLLDRYVGKELSVILPDPADADARILRKATLLSSGGVPVFLVGNEVYLGEALAYLLPQLPEDVQEEPTLTLRTDNEAAGKQAIRLSYLMGGLTWKTDYVLTLDPSGESGALDAWATLVNSSGCAFAGAALKLVAGDVRQAPVRNYRAAPKAVMLEAAAADSAPVQESFSQFHLYTVPDRVDLSAGGTRQVSLFGAPKVAVRQELSTRYGAGVHQLSRSVEQSVDVGLQMDNTAAKGLGKPMPGGLMRVFMPASDGSVLLAGESSLGHTGVGGEVKLSLGRAFDVKAERVQTEFVKLGKRSVKMGWRIGVINGRSKPQALKLTDSYPGQWEVTAADHKYTRPDAGSLVFDVMVPPTPDGTPMYINYTVQVTY
jgi:hypothetical protein